MIDRWTDRLENGQFGSRQTDKWIVWKKRWKDRQFGKKMDKQMDIERWTDIQFGNNICTYGQKDRQLRKIGQTGGQVILQFGNQIDRKKFGNIDRQIVCTDRLMDRQIDKLETGKTDRYK